MVRETKKGGGGNGQGRMCPVASESGAGRRGGWGGWGNVLEAQGRAEGVEGLWGVVKGEKVGKAGLDCVGWGELG